MHFSSAIYQQGKEKILKHSALNSITLEALEVHTYTFIEYLRTYSKLASVEVAQRLIKAKLHIPHSQSSTYFLRLKYFAGIDISAHTSF